MNPPSQHLHPFFPLLAAFFYFSLARKTPVAALIPMKVRASLCTILTDGPPLISSARISFVLIVNCKPHGSQVNTTVIQRNLTTVACDRHNKITPHEILFAAGIPTAIESIPVAYPTLLSDMEAAQSNQSCSHGKDGFIGFVRLMIA